MFLSIYTHLPAYLSVFDKYKLRMEFYILLNASPSTRGEVYFVIYELYMQILIYELCLQILFFLVHLCTLQVCVDEAYQY